MMKRNLLILLVMFTALSLWRCTDKFDMPDVTNANSSNIAGDTIYIQQNPVWTGFNRPQDLIIGREPFLYVADTDNDRIVMMNLAGEILGTKSVQKPIAIAQDHLLNLIVCGELTDNSGNVYSAVFKIHLFDAHHNLASAKMDTLLPKTSFDYSRPDRKYTGVTTFYDNSFYVSRTGPINSSPVDPDNSILIFHLLKKPDGSRKDTLIGRVPLIEPEGTGVVSANQISSLTSFERNNIDIITTLVGENSFKVQWLQYIVTPLFSGYISALEPFSVDLMKVNKFGKPEDVCLDDKNNIFVADAEKDSIFKFNSFGDEMESFGGSDVFNSPHAVAYHDRTLYVVDTENNRILRFILSTEID